MLHFLCLNFASFLCKLVVIFRLLASSSRCFSFFGGWGWAFPVFSLSFSTATLLLTFSCHVVRSSRIPLSSDMMRSSSGTRTPIFVPQQRQPAIGSDGRVSLVATATLTPLSSTGATPLRSAHPTPLAHPPSPARPPPSAATLFAISSQPPRRSVNDCMGPPAHFSETEIPLDLALENIDGPPSVPCDYNRDYCFPATVANIDHSTNRTTFLLVSNLGDLHCLYHSFSRPFEKRTWNLVSGSTYYFQVRLCGAISAVGPACYPTVGYNYQISSMQVSDLSTPFQMRDFALCEFLPSVTSDTPSPFRPLPFRVPFVIWVTEVRLFRGSLVIAVQDGSYDGIESFPDGRAPPAKTAFALLRTSESELATLRERSGSDSLSRTQWRVAARAVLANVVQHEPRVHLRDTLFFEWEFMSRDSKRSRSTSPDEAPVNATSVAPVVHNLDAVSAVPPLDTECDLLESDIDEVRESLDGEKCDDPEYDYEESACLEEHFEEEEAAALESSSGSSAAQQSGSCATPTLLPPTYLFCLPFHLSFPSFFLHFAG